MFLLCGHVNPPGTSSCDKAQLIAAARSEGSSAFTGRAHEEHGAQPRAGLARPPAKPCGALQYWVMAWEFTLSTASSGEGQVWATRMGASGTCKMWNHYSRETQSIFLPLNSPITMSEPELYNQSNVDFFFFFCQRQFWISHSLVNSNQLNKFTHTKNSMYIRLRRTRWQEPGHWRRLPQVPSLLTCLVYHRMLWRPLRRKAPSLSEKEVPSLSLTSRVLDLGVSCHKL